MSVLVAVGILAAWLASVFLTAVDGMRMRLPRRAGAVKQSLPTRTACCA